MVEKKLLIVAVEGTSEMERNSHWKEILTDYLKKIIRCFSPNDLAGQELSAADIELSLVVFRDPGHACLVERSGWTRDVNVFLQWLAAISFTGGGFDEAAIGEGLFEALMMFSLVPGSQVHKHCILVGASNPYPLLTPDIEVPRESYPVNAEIIAKKFAQYSISLSVISPKQLSKLIAIYKAGNPNSQAATVGNPQFLVLLSENFKEACAALKSVSVGNIACATVEVPLGDIQRTVSINQSVAGISQGNLSGTQIEQSGVGKNHIINGLGASNMSFETGTMVPTPGMSQQGLTELQPLEVTNSSTTNMSFPLQTSGGAPDRWMPVWKGTLSTWKQGEPSPYIITELEGYRNPMTSEMLATDWPERMQINLLISTNKMHDKRYEGISEFLFFRALNQHRYLEKLHQNSLCAVIHLPSQSLLLAVSDASSLIGVLLPGQYLPSPVQHQMAGEEMLSSRKRNVCSGPNMPEDEVSTWFNNQQQ